MDTDGQILELETVVTDLGVLLDSHMTFTMHADHIAQQNVLSTLLSITYPTLFN